MSEQHSDTTAVTPETAGSEAQPQDAQRPRRAYETPRAVLGRSVHSVTLALGSGGAAPTSPALKRRR